VKILRWTAILLLFILAVFLARENDALVDLVYHPGVPLSGLEEPRSITVPLFVLVLVTLGLGGVLGGGLALFQQTSLNLKLRRREKDSARLTNDVAAVREKLGLVTAQLDEARREAAELRGSIDAAGEDLAIEARDETVHLAVEEPVAAADPEPDTHDPDAHEPDSSAAGAGEHERTKESG